MDRRTVSGLMIILVLIGILSFTFKIQRVDASGTIYIRADGSIDPPTANVTTADNATYIFTGNIHDSIVVERDNIVIDGARYTLQGMGSGNGISLGSRSNVTVKNLTIKAFWYGIWSLRARSIVISRANIVGNSIHGIVLNNSSDNIISQNNIAANNNTGLYLNIGCSGNRILGNNIANNEYGIHLFSCSDNYIHRNKVTKNGIHGMTFRGESSNNSISGNNIANNEAGICLYEGSNHNNVRGNNITANNLHGIYFYQSSNNSVSGNNIANNLYGIVLSGCSNNIFYHNNFVDNSFQAVADGVNAWDDGYPSGGNYWSDYNGTDLYREQFQNETGYDGIGDTAYVIDVNNTDNYPLIHPYGSIRNLDSNQTYLTIQSAIDAPETLDEHTIFVKEGIYYENVVLDKSLALTGEEKEATIVDGNGTGTVVYVNASRVRISDLTLRNSGPGWHDSGVHINTSVATKCNITDNIILCTTGIYLRHEFGYSNSTDCILSDNTIIGNRAGAGFYFYFYPTGNLLTNNQIMNNSVGISIYSSLNTISGNVIEDNDLGIGIYHGGHDNLIFHNNWINNVAQVTCFGANIWDNGYPSGGNFWSNYADVDLYCGPNQDIPSKDGIWDSPYVIDANSTDNYPLLKPYASGNLSVSLSLDKYTYHTGDKMYVGLKVVNPDSVKYVCFALWCTLPDSSVYLHMHEHSVVLQIGLEYVCSQFAFFILPTLPLGNYTWRAAFLDRATHTIIVEDTAEWAFTALSIAIYTDKYTYHAGDTMDLGLNLSNTDSAIVVDFKIWIVLPGGGSYVCKDIPSVTIPAGLEYSNPSFDTITLPSIPPGTYVWHAAFLDPTTHTIIVEDTAEWAFS